VRIVFCLPGEQFSGHFLDLWSETLFYCIRSGIQCFISRKQSNNIYYVRNMCLGASVERGRLQKPFNGQIDYDYTCWIDNDSLYTPAMIQRLLNHNVDIVAGLQAMEDGAHFTCGKLDESYFAEHKAMQQYTAEDIKSLTRLENGLLDVDYTGFGLVLIKRGVYEAMEYPWFRPEWYEIGECRDFSMEDVGFCIGAKKAGFTIHVDPEVRVGHLKPSIF